MTAQFPTFIVTASTPTMLNGTFGAHRVFGSEEAVADIASAVASHAKRPAVVTICVHECIGHNGGGKPMAGRQVATLARMADGSFAVAWGIEVPGLPHLTLGRHAFAAPARPPPGRPAHMLSITVTPALWCVRHRGRIIALVTGDSRESAGQNVASLLGDHDPDDLRIAEVGIAKPGAATVVMDLRSPQSQHPPDRTERYPFGTVQDYRTNDFIRAATEAERAASIAAARRDGGVGAIDDPLCPGRTIFVEE